MTRSSFRKTPVWLVDNETRHCGGDTSGSLSRHATLYPISPYRGYHEVASADNLIRSALVCPLLAFDGEMAAGSASYGTFGDARPPISHRLAV